VRSQESASSKTQHRNVLILQECPRAENCTSGAGTSGRDQGVGTGLVLCCRQSVALPSPDTEVCPVPRSASQERETTEPGAGALALPRGGAHTWATREAGLETSLLAAGFRKEGEGRGREVLEVKVGC
jgi:hypothetical protein